MLKNNRLIVEIPIELKQKFKMECIKQNLTQKEFMIKILKSYLQ